MFSESNFNLKSFKLDCQYASLYYSRLVKIKKEFSNLSYSYPILGSISEAAKHTETVIIIGTTFKHQTIDNILMELEEKTGLTNGFDILADRPYQFGDNYRNDDKLYLEDDTFKIELINIDYCKIVTGCILACVGKYVDGKFACDRFEFLPSCRVAKSCSESIGLIGNLNFNNIPYEGDQYLSLLSKFLISNDYSLFSNKENINTNGCSKLDWLFIIGLFEKGEAAAIAQFDQFLHKILTTNTTLKVHLIPGSHDPTNFMLPQQKLNSVLFPLSSKSNRIMSHTNPVKVCIDDCELIIFSDVGIKDIRLYSQ